MVGLCKHPINLPDVLNICICWTFLKSRLIQKTPESSKGLDLPGFPGSSQISRLCYRSCGSSCFRRKSRLEMANRKPGQEWGLLTSRGGHCLPPAFCLAHPSLFTPFSFLPPPPPLHPLPSPLLSLHSLFLPHILPWLKCTHVHWKFSVLPRPLQHCCLCFIFVSKFNNCLYTFLYLIILLWQQQQNQHLAFKNRIFSMPLGPLQRWRGPRWMSWSSEQMFPTRIRGSLVPPRPSCPLSSPMASATLNIHHVGCCGLCSSALLPAFCLLHIKHGCCCNQFLHPGALACRDRRDFPMLLTCVP